jgi:hypothetical protein
LLQTGLECIKKKSSSHEHLWRKESAEAAAKSAEAAAESAEAAAEKLSSWPEAISVENMWVA